MLSLIPCLYHPVDTVNYSLHDNYKALCGVNDQLRLSALIYITKSQNGSKLSFACSSNPLSSIVKAPLNHVLLGCRVGYELSKTPPSPSIYDRVCVCVYVSRKRLVLLVSIHHSISPPISIGGWWVRGRMMKGGGAQKGDINLNIFYIAVRFAVRCFLPCVCVCAVWYT